MAASSTLPQPNVSRKSQIGKTGVLTLSGFGIKVRMQRGHLEIEDGVGMRTTHDQTSSCRARPEAADCDRF